MQRAIISSINILLRLHPQTIQLIVLAHTSMATPYNIDLTDRWSKTRTFFPITFPPRYLVFTKTTFTGLGAVYGLLILTACEILAYFFPDDLNLE